MIQEAGLFGYRLIMTPWSRVRRFPGAPLHFLSAPGILTTGVVNKLTDLISLLGLTEYEGRVYRALLAESPATAYRLGKVSGVPLSRVYEAANRLVDKGAATIESGDPVRYLPVSPSTLIAEARARTASQLESLDQELSTLFRADSEAQDAWVRGEQQVLARVTAVTQGAGRQILIAMPRSLRGKLQSAIEARPGLLVDFLAVDDRGPTFAILVDGGTAVIGSLGDSARALITRDQSFAALLNDYFRTKLRTDSVRPSASTQPPIDLHADWLDWEKEKQDRLLGIRIPVERR